MTPRTSQAPPARAPAPVHATNGGGPAVTGRPSLNGNGHPDYEVVWDGTNGQRLEQRVAHKSPVGNGRVGWVPFRVDEDDHEPGRALMESDFFEDVSR